MLTMLANEQLTETQIQEQIRLAEDNAAVTDAIHWRAALGVHRARVARKTGQGPKCPSEAYRGLGEAI